MSGTNLTTNINMLSPTGFKLTINKEKFANTEFFITSFTIPDISVSPIETRYRNSINYEAGEPRSFGDLSLRFAIDEDMKNYTEIYDWLKSCSEEGSVKGQIEQHDMILSVMSSHNNINKQFQFRDAFPTSLSGVEFNAQSTDVEYLQADVTFRYNEFSIIK
jgi:hypothetical protein